MFNLLMQSVPWEGGRGSVDLDRLFEFTEEGLAAQHRGEPGGAPLLGQLAEYPCLFMLEGTRNQLGRVGRITRPRAVGRRVTFEYTFDPEVPPLTNETIFANRADFDMPHEFEFSRNHWAIKDVDLYRVLLRLVRPRRQLPTVFALAEHEHIEEELVSVMMPFDAAFATVYEAITPTTRCITR